MLHAIMSHLRLRVAQSHYLSDRGKRPAHKGTSASTDHTSRLSPPWLTRWVLVTWMVLAGAGCAALAPVDDDWEEKQRDFTYLAQLAQQAEDAYMCRPEVVTKYEQDYTVRYFYEKFFGEEVGCRYDGLVTFHRAFVLIPTCRTAGNCPKERTIVVKGSETLGDWLVNFAIDPFRDPEYRAKYHQGFRLAAAKLPVKTTFVKHTVM